MSTLALLTISDAGAAGARVDRSGDAIAVWAASQPFDMVARAIVPDESLLITRTLLEWCSTLAPDVIITTGGTGFGPRDITPEATRSLIERDAPGLMEAIRAAGLAETPRAALTRGIAGVRGSTLIVNLPGSLAAVESALRVLSPLAGHIAALMHGNTEH